MDGQQLGGIHLAELYFEQVVARGKIEVLPYRRFTDMLNQKDRAYLTARRGLVQPANEALSQQVGQYEVIIPRTSVICGIMVQEGTPPSHYNPTEYRVKKQPRAAFCAFANYAVVGYYHLREGITLVEWFDLLQDDFIPLTNCNFYQLAAPNIAPRAVKLAVINRRHISTFYFME